MKAGWSILFLFTSIICASDGRAGAPVNPVVVLVPGFFNSLAYGYNREHRDVKDVAPYFSVSIVEAIESFGYDVSVVDNLRPVGSVEENGKLLADHLLKVRELFHSRSVLVIAHSAGGLYLLSALSRHSFPEIRSVVTLGTPYEGGTLVDNLDRRWSGLRYLLSYVHLDNLLELRRNETVDFINHQNWPKQVRWVAIGGYQKSCRLLDCHRSQKLSWIMSLGQKIVGVKSDGVISYDSALAAHLDLPLERWEDLSVPLEHWEMVQDWRLFSLLGVTNSRWIEQKQKEIYSEILRRLGRE